MWIHIWISNPHGSAFFLVGRIRIRIENSCGSGSRRAKMIHKSEEMLNFEVLDVLF
jgi:hypothetical protein